MGLNNPGGYKGAVKPKCPIINGGFETGDFTGWITYAGTGAGTVTVEPGDAAEGNYYARLQQPWANYWYRIEQTINCDPTGLNIHFQYRTAPEVGDAYYFVWLWEHTSMNLIWLPAGQTTWTTYDAPLPPSFPDPAQPFRLRFIAYAAWLGPVVLDIDDVYLYQP